MRPAKRERHVAWGGAQRNPRINAQNQARPERAEEKDANVMAGTYTNILFHVVFSTKGRRALITTELQPRLYEYLGGIVRGEKGILYEIGGTANHIHLFFRWRTDETLATLMGNLKSRSSLWVHQTFPERKSFHWQAGYGAFSVSQSQYEKVRNYIVYQPDHHKKKSFKEEFIELLKAHGIEYDERYIWE